MPGVEEEGDPVFCLVEDFGEEDQVGGVIGGGLDVDASQLHILGAGQFGLSFDVPDGREWRFD